MASLVNVSAQRAVPPRSFPVRTAPERAEVVLPERPTATERFIAERIEPVFRDFRYLQHSVDHAGLIHAAAHLRGLTVRAVSEGHLTFELNGTVIGGMTETVTTLLSAQGRTVTDSQELIREHLKLMDVPRAGKAPSPELLQLCAFVVGDELVAAQLRVPFYVIGDGQSTVERLVEAEMERWRTHVLLARRLPQLSDARMESLTARPDEVPSRGRLLILGEDAWSGSGSLPVDVTDLLSAEVAGVAVSGLRALPGVYAGEVRMQASGVETAAEAEVITVKPDVNIQAYHFPAYGNPRDVASAIVEQLLERASK